MLGWALTFLVIAIIAAVFGFGGIAATASSIAQILFVVFLALFLVSVMSRWRAGGRRRSRNCKQAPLTNSRL
jgi:uncharacterized membrane protein YtjA (UPF0391 family)